MPVMYKCKQTEDKPMKYVQIINGDEVTTYTTIAPSGREVVIGEDIRYTGVHGPNAAVGSSWEGMLNSEYSFEEEYSGAIIWKDSLEEFDDYQPRG
jgi:hypothetical protein